MTAVQDTLTVQLEYFDHSMSQNWPEYYLILTQITIPVRRLFESIYDDQFATLLQLLVSCPVEAINTMYVDWQLSLYSARESLLSMKRNACCC